MDPVTQQFYAGGTGAVDCCAGCLPGGGTGAADRAVAFDAWPPPPPPLPAL
ncbi:hypothetical protein R5W23_003268 [Gemmata sp. JC673]|uniref:Uncharacterized protein n=1 Tax=Gemmata algarum TaxID=2975278 RepID=A0ABU5F526_9BACT|nr:hypothetical protein [Gemmata algarum]MDY3561840.1 hypothetical protein [Gemmata algarum]